MTVDDEYAIEPTDEHLPKKREIVFSGQPLADFILRRRLELDLSLAQLEARSGINATRINDWERGRGMPGHPARLTALAKALDVPAADLYTLAGVDVSDELPSMQPYLRSKYGDQLPPEALADIERYTARVAARYGVSTGPAPGEDEQPDNNP